jgi:hypothetical protein
MEDPPVVSIMRLTLAEGKGFTTDRFGRPVRRRALDQATFWRERDFGSGAGASSSIRPPGRPRPIDFARAERCAA